MKLVNKILYIKIKPSNNIYHAFHKLFELKTNMLPNCLALLRVYETVIG